MITVPQLLALKVAGHSLTGTAQIQASTSSFDAVDAQHIDTDDIDVQTIEVESNLVSPAGTIGNLMQLHSRCIQL